MKDFNRSTLLLLSFFIIGAIVLGAKLHNKTNGESAVLIGFAGDVMIGRLVNETIQQRGYSYPWGNTISLLKKPDITLINLETTLTTQTLAVPKVFNFKASPSSVKTLQEANIDIVNLANNHVLDFGQKGLLETIDVLDSANIKHIGAGKNIQETQQPVILKKNTISIGFIGYTDNEPTWLATATNPGTNYIKVGDSEKIKDSITKLRDTVDIIILSIHWGPNMREKPSQEFVHFAHEMIDMGIDIIHGHSAHIFQGVEIYKNKLILYDTGDFVDDYVVDPLLPNDQSFFFEVTVDKDGPAHVQLTPVIIRDMQVNIAEGNTKTTIIKKMQQLSAQFGTHINDDGTIDIKK